MPRYVVDSQDRTADMDFAQTNWSLKVRNYQKIIGTLCFRELLYQEGLLLGISKILLEVQKYLLLKDSYLVNYFNLKNF